MFSIRFFLLLFIITSNCYSQNNFERTTRYILSLENRSYYDSSEYNLFSFGTAMSRGVNFEMQWNFSPRISWNNEIQFVKFYPNKKQRNILDVAGLATKVKGYWFVNDERYDGIKHWFNPYAQYGFVLTRMLTLPSKQFVSMVSAVGTEMYSNRLYRTFAQVNYSLGFGTESKNFISLQFGGSYNFDSKNREENYKLQKQNEKKLAQIEHDFEQYRIKSAIDSMEKSVNLTKINQELYEKNQIADSLWMNNKHLVNELTNCYQSYATTKDSLQSANALLNEFKLKQWQKFEWMTIDTLLTSKKGYFAVALQTYNLEVIISQKNANKLPYPFAIIKNKYNAYRLLYYIETDKNERIENKLRNVVQIFPLAEIVKIDEF